MNVFDRYAPFVQDFVYAHGWEDLRGIQLAAAEAIFNTDANVLLTASTASGKTEAAFFPILTELWEDPAASVGALYIGPLKALINDQFLRLNDLCMEAGIAVWHWHGDVSQSHKSRLLKHPSGILQITPESLESLLLHKHAAIGALFGDLRYVVIDEVHSLLRGDRGGQTLCGIERLSRLAGVNPRRIGLSATIGNPELAGQYLAQGTGRDTIIPRIASSGQQWRISMEHFYITGPQAPDRERVWEASEGGTGTEATEHTMSDDRLLRDVDAPTAARIDEPSAEPSYELGSVAVSSELTQSQRIASKRQRATDIPVERVSLPDLEDPSDLAPSWSDPGLGYVFEHTKGHKSLVFVNSREECEAITTSLRQYCKANGEADRFLIHHGNLSQSFRETAEEFMRDDELALTTVTTATLELGIDIGRLERAFQIDAPFMVSSFLQRMGRTGRRGQPAEMWFVMREEQPEARALLPETVPWKLLQGIALIQLYLEERWVEPPMLEGLPYSLLYHQVMATLASDGELSPAMLAERILTLTPFHRISTDDLRSLLHHLIDRDHIEVTESGGLIVGLAGERVTNNFRFYAVFQENEEYTVRSESQAIGTIVQPPPAGERIALAGHVWVVEEVDHKRHLIEATMVEGKVPAYFGQVAGSIDTRVLERMRTVLAEDLSYPYLLRNARSRLSQARHVADNAHIVTEPLICLGGNMWCLFPWLGSFAFLALERFIKIRCAHKLGIKGFDPSRPYFIQLKMKASAEEFFDVLYEQAQLPLDPMELVYPGEVPYFDKYDEFVPDDLVRKGFAYGVLDIDGMLKRVCEWHDMRHVR